MTLPLGPGGPSLGEWLGWLGAAFSLGTSWMRTMIPLRALAMAANLCGLAYGLTTGSGPTMLVNGVLLPLNAWRLWQMVVLTRRVREASRGDPSMDWLKPFTTRRAVRAGEVVFAKGDEADSMLYLLTGRFRLVELDLERGPGEVIGELGMVAPDRRRTQTLRAETAGEVLVITYDQVRQLCVQNPEFGFYFLHLASGRLFQNLRELERRLEAGTAAVTAGATATASAANDGRGPAAGGITAGSGP
jgi:hypothetical protein